MLIFRQSYQSGKVDAGDSPQQPRRLKQHHEGYLFARTTLILTQDNTDIKNKNNKSEDCDAFFYENKNWSITVPITLYNISYTVAVPAIAAWQSSFRQGSQLFSSQQANSHEPEKILEF